MTSRRALRPIPAVLIAMFLLAGLPAGCEFSGEVPEPPEVESQPAPTPAAADAQLTGPFRRKGVPVPPEILAAAAERCRLTPTPRFTSEVGDRHIVVADMRGEGIVLLVFADDEAAVGCRITVAGDGSMRATFFRVAEPAPGSLARDDLTLGAMEYVDDADGQLVIAAGQVGDGAVHVRAGFDDDTYTTATIEDGWWVMWWPGQVRPASITADDNKNVVIASVDPP